MIVDFQHHYTPAELLKTSGGASALQAGLDENGNPRYLYHPLLADLDAHVRMMDKAGIDAAVLSCAEGFDNTNLEVCRLINDRMRDAMRNYPGRFIGLAHVPTMAGPQGLKELGRCAGDLGFPGVVIGSELQGLPLDAPALEPFWAEASRLGLYVFVHPLAKVIDWSQLYADDLGRVVGWEFSLMVAALRLIDGGVLDRHPDLVVQFAHYAGGLGRYMGRVRGFHQRELWGTAKVPGHGRRPQRSFDHYMRQRLFYDCAGWAGPNNAAREGMEWIRFGMMEVPLSQTVFATDYPQAVRDDDEVCAYVQAIREMGADGQTILAGNAGKLIATLPKATETKKGARV